MTATTGIKLDNETRQRLESLAELRDRSPHWLMCTAIKLYLEREEQYEREKKEDMQRWHEYQLTGQAIAHDKAAQWLTKLAEGKTAPCPK